MEVKSHVSYLQKFRWIRCNPTLSGFSGLMEGYGGSISRKLRLEIRRNGEEYCRSRLLQVAHVYSFFYLVRIYEFIRFGVVCGDV